MRDFFLTYHFFTNYFMILGRGEMFFAAGITYSFWGHKNYNIIRILYKLNAYVQVKGYYHPTLNIAGKNRRGFHTYNQKRQICKPCIKSPHLLSFSPKTNHPICLIIHFFNLNSI